MSSGERAKPPATFEERNPFDISRRSGPEVASEIAKRMAAWKQARARTAPPPAVTPGGDAKSPAIAAPVQPARMPKPSSQPAPSPRSAGNASPRVPYFASASATRRAMPPAPSLTQGSQRPPAPAGDAPAARADGPGFAAPVLDQVTPSRDDSTVKTEAALAVTATAGSPVAEIPLEAAAPPAATQPGELPVEPPSVAGIPDPTPDDTERSRAEARAIKARWIAAHDLDALIDTADAGSPSPAEAAAPAHEAGIGEGPDTPADQPQAAAGDLDHPIPDEMRSAERAATLEAVADVEAPVPGIETAAETVLSEVPDDATARLEAAATAPAAPAPVRDIAREKPVLDLATLDEMAGRKEPTFDAPSACAAPGMPADEPQEQRATHAAAEPADRDALDEGLGIVASDEAAGRREPTFDTPANRAAPASPVQAAELPATSQARAHETRIEAAPDTAAEDSPAVDGPYQLSTAALDEAAGRRVPTFDVPARPAQPAQTAAPRIALRPIETRIEARRLDTLRADPQLAVRRPIFPHIEPEEWDVPPMVTAHARQARRGTSWAIGLGAALLIAGITAPAAIWQQGRQLGDRAVPANLLSATGQVETSAPTTNATAQAPAQATPPAPPQPETPAASAATQPSNAPDPAAPQPEAAPPAVAAQESNAPIPAVPKPDQAEAKPATTLNAIGDGGEVVAAPVVPPAPTVNLASKPDTAGTGALMVARPFVPRPGNGSFLQAPTTGTTSVPVAGAPVQSAAVGVKPNLMGQLKPKAATSASAARPVAGKPISRKPKPFFQQSPEQMFETLIETLSEGKPANPATKPVAPSSRR